jgi:hypothetical protein
MAERGGGGGGLGLIAQAAEPLEDCDENAIRAELLQLRDEVSLLAVMDRLPLGVLLDQRQRIAAKGDPERRRGSS